MDKTLPTMHNQEKDAKTSIRLYGMKRMKRMTKKSTDHTKEKLQKSVESLKHLINHIHAGVVVHAPDTRILMANEHASRILGLSIEQMIGKTAIDPAWRFLREDEAPMPHEEYPVARVLAEGSSLQNMVLGVIRSDTNDTVWILANAFIEFESDGQVRQVIMTFVDITERMQVEEALRVNTANMSAIIENTQDSIWTINRSYKIVYVNTVFEKAFLASFGAHLKPGVVLLEALPEPMRPLWKSRYDRVFGGERFEIVDEIDLGGRIVYIEVMFNPIIVNDNVVGASFFGRDITERKRIEEALQNTQKLEALGILAGGIAHDFNNLLAGIFGSIDMANVSISTGKPEQARKELAEAFSVFDRAKALTRQLLTFAKGGAPMRKKIDIVPLIKNNTQFSLSGSNVISVCTIAEDLWPCDCDEHQIGQAIDNIVINAQQAMPVGGKILVSAENICIEPDQVNAGRSAGNYVKISIQDHGIGIAKEFLTKIYDPFFTTKAKGHGLGLSTTYSIVTRHGGWIDVESELGTGTTFHVFLPSLQDAITSEKSHYSEEHKGSGTILIMDDEDYMRRVERHMLKKMGYDVKEAKNGREAIDLFTEVHASGEDFVLTILDLTIPNGIGGKDTAKAIRQIDENAIVIVASGYADDPVMENPTEYGFADKIAKPFRNTELAELLELHVNK